MSAQAAPSDAMSSPASAASAAWTLQSDLGGLVTLGIKHTSAFERRQKLLLSLLESIRRRYGTSLRIVVADDGDGDEAHRAALRGQGVEVQVRQDVDFEGMTRCRG